MTDTTAPAAPASTTANSGGRDTIALKVLGISGIGIFLIAVAVLLVALVNFYYAGAYDQKEKSLTLITTVFNTLVPMFGTWVGTVIAFYFARENFEAASKQTQNLVQQLGDDRLKKIKVQDAWTPAKAITGVVVETGDEAKCDFNTQIVKLLEGDNVSRVVVWNAGKVVSYIIHQSAIYQYLALRKDKDTNAKPTLADFLAFALGGDKTMKDVVTKIGWVPQSASLADAKAKMEGTPDCQDVFVTASGSDKEGVMGWVTNVDIAKNSKA